MTGRLDDMKNRYGRDLRVLNRRLADRRRNRLPPSDARIRSRPALRWSQIVLVLMEHRQGPCVQPFHAQESKR